MDVILKDLHWRGSKEHRSWSGGITVCLARDNLHILPVVPSRRWAEEGDGNSYFVHVILLKEYSSASGVWERVKKLKRSIEVCQNSNVLFNLLLTRIANGTYPGNVLLSLKSTSKMDEVYKHV